MCVYDWFPWDTIRKSTGLQGDHNRKSIPARQSDRLQIQIQMFKFEFECPGDLTVVYGWVPVNEINSYIKFIISIPVDGLSQLINVFPCISTEMYLVNVVSFLVAIKLSHRYEYVYTVKSLI